MTQSKSSDQQYANPGLSSPQTEAPPTDGPTRSTKSSAAGIIISYATAFIAYACVMTIELLAERLTARFLGSSIYTWTSIIGIVLFGLSVGNYVGGRLADRYRPHPTLAILFILASAACLFVPWLNNMAGDWSALWYLSWPQRIAAHVTLTFALPAIVLGTIGPVIAKMALDFGRDTGRTVGGVYAWSGIGSLAGTYVSGFFLIERMGASTIIYLVAVALGVMAILFAVRHWFPYLWSVVAVLVTIVGIGPWAWSRSLATELGFRERNETEVLFDRTSLYSRVRVEKVSGKPSQRVLKLDKLAHSFYDVEKPNALLYGYERVYAAVTDHVAGEREAINVLILGGGGYTHPRYILHRRPNSQVYVVEIDPVVTEAARTAFGLQPDPRMKITHMDARQYLLDLIRQKEAGGDIPEFDFIFLDAVHDYDVPFHLTTRECQQLCEKLLAPDGVYMINLIDILNVGEFMGALLNTVRQTFGFVACYSASDGQNEFDGNVRNTFVIVASKRDLNLEQMAGSELMDQTRRLLLPQDRIKPVISRTSGRILTDDYAPVEYLLAGVVQRSGEDAFLGFYNRGNRQLDAGLLEEAAASFERAIEGRPDFAPAYIDLGRARALQRRFPEAAAAFRSAASLEPDMPEPVFNLGWVFMQSRDYKSAAETFRAAVRINQDFAKGYHSLGMALAELGNYKESIAAFESALAIEPDNTDIRNNLDQVRAVLDAAR